MSELLGSPVGNRPLHLIWIVGVSESMSGAKIDSLNISVKSCIPSIQKIGSENPHVQILVRVATFSTGARWHIGQPTPVEQFTWSDVSAGGATDMGNALAMVAEQLRTPPMTDRALPPVLVLVSDGRPTDDVDAGLKELVNEPWGYNAVRIAVGIGSDIEDGPLTKFMGRPGHQPLRAHNASALVTSIAWASTAVLKAISTPMPQLLAAPGKMGGS